VLERFSGEIKKASFLSGFFDSTQIKAGQVVSVFTIPAPTSTGT